MSAPQPAEGVKEAVRRVRLAAASVTNPLGLFGIAAAAAEVVPAALEPALETLAPSPFGMLAGLVGSQGGAAAARGRSGAGARAPAARGRGPTPAGTAPAASATGPTAAMAALGRFVTDELVALGVTAPPPQRQQPGFGAEVAQIVGPLLAELQPPPPPGGVDDVFTAMGLFPASQAERVGSAVAVATAGAGAPPVVTGVAKTAATGIAAGFGLLEELVTGEAPPRSGPAGSTLGGLFAGLQPPQPASRRRSGGSPAAPAGAAPAAGAQPGQPGSPPAGSVPTLDETRRRLLDPTGAAGSDPAAAPVAAAAPPPDPDDLAWLVNEALVEQARRHGVDLS